MRLHDLSEDMLFDELEDDTGPNTKIFISSLLTLPNILVKPKNFKAKIYASKNLVSPLRTYFLNNNIKLNQTDIVKLVPNVPIELQDDKVGPIEVVMFESEDINKNVMFMFRKAKKTTHVYAGVCRELRSFIFNNVFVEWIKDGVSKLYVDVTRASTDERDVRELENTIDTIENLINKDPKVLILNVPKLGYETLVYRISQRLRARVSVGGIMHAVFQTLEKSQYFVSNYKDAKIITVHKSYALQEMQTAYKAKKYVFVQITDKTRDIFEHIGFYELGWSPLPTAFELQLLATILHPDSIYAIHHSSYDTRMTPQVPVYLLKLCLHYVQIVEEMQQAKNNELKALEDISSLTSTDNSLIGEYNGGTMKLTQEISTCEDRQKRVHEWLTGYQENDVTVDQNSEIKIAKKDSAKSDKNAKPNKSSSITKSLAQARQKEKSKKLTASENLFLIQKGSLKYLEDSDST